MRPAVTEGGSRLGRWVGLVEFWATMAAVAGLILWPKVVGAIWATVTWTQDEKDACTAVPGCVVNLVPGGVVPVGWAIAWVAVILAGIVLCWSPDRWWTSRGRGPFEFIADSSPRWLRAHAGVSAVVCLLLVLPGRGITTTWAFEYAIPTALGLAAAGLATLSIRHARRILPAATFHRLVGDSILIDGVERQLARKSRAKPLPASTREGYDRAPAGKRAGRVIAWTVAVAGILATFFIALFPFVGQFVALGTWSADERESCIATDGCSVTVLSIGAGYAWVGLAWVAIVIAAILICWSPRRWWTPTGSVTPLRPGVFSTPEWFRLHALGALAINAIGLAITGGRLQDSWVWEFLWPIALAGVAIILATVCVRATAAHIDPATREGLAKSYDFWLSRRECLLRSRVPVGSRIRVPLKGDTDRSEPPMGAC